MSNQITLNVSNLIGSELCISAEDGQKVFAKIAPLVQDGEKVTISFDRITMLISLFLYVAIGQLYGSFSEEQIRAQLNVDGLAPDDIELLKEVVDNAKRYYANKDAYDKAWQDDNIEEWLL